MTSPDVTGESRPMMTTHRASTTTGHHSDEDTACESSKQKTDDFYTPAYENGFELLKKIIHDKCECRASYVGNEWECSASITYIYRAK